MLPISVIIREYSTENATNSFRKWFNQLNSPAAAKVAVALSRMETGNLSNVKWFKRIGKYKINWGPGHRIYIAQDGNRLIILFGGGTKKSQKKDIEKEIQLSQEYKQRKKKDK